MAQKEETDYLNASLQDLQRDLLTSPAGLSSDEAGRRLQTYGPNELIHREIPGWLQYFLKALLNPLIILLAAASILSFYFGEKSGAGIIIVMVLVSAILQSTQEYRSNKAAAALRSRVAVTVTVHRDGKPQEIPATSVVPGDIVELTAGDLVPGDARLISANALFADQAALTGEPYPMEKIASAEEKSASKMADIDYAVFLGTSISSGVGVALVVSTGKHTEYGHIFNALSAKPPQTEFERSIKDFSFFLLRIIFILVMVIFFLNTLLGKGVQGSFLFALAVAVGITPELLPVIITVTLAAGAIALAKDKVIVKRLAALENLGSMDILCTDKTGTLTAGRLSLEGYESADGVRLEKLINYAYINSFMQSGLKSPIDKTIEETAPRDISNFVKIDEVPFDFKRREISIAVKCAEEEILISKGAPETLIPESTFYEAHNEVMTLDPKKRQAVMQRFHDLSSQGFRVLAVAYRLLSTDQQTVNTQAEQQLIFLGFLYFADPPKESAVEELKALDGMGVRVKILTGDNKELAVQVCKRMELGVEGVLAGEDIDRMSEHQLTGIVLTTNVFARLTPIQKERVIKALRKTGHVVGYLGDGINDAPSLRSADVGISVDNAVGVAKEAADIILLDKSLSSIHRGVTEGRKTFLNTMKYIMMVTSSNFGNMFSLPVASLLVPFLPMLPLQILLNNLLYDTSQVAIPADNVDTEDLKHPQRWDIDLIRHFMLIFGPVSSVFDVMAYIVMLNIFHAGSTSFRTGWFVESLVTQVMVVHVIRTRKSFLTSKANRYLIASTLAVTAAGILLPYTFVGRYFFFVPLPLYFLLTLLLLSIAYLFIVEEIKKYFYRKAARSITQT